MVPTEEPSTMTVPPGASRVFDPSQIDLQAWLLPDAARNARPVVHLLLRLPSPRPDLFKSS